MEAHEEDEDAFPAQYCVNLWEELVGAWGEGVREERRTLCRLLGSENPRQEDVKLLALAPGEDGLPAFKFPDTFDLKSPTGYYQTVVVPKQDRALSRFLHKQLREASAKGKKVGLEEETGGGRRQSSSTPAQGSVPVRQEADPRGVQALAAARPKGCGDRGADLLGQRHLGVLC